MISCVTPMLLLTFSHLTMRAHHFTYSVLPRFQGLVHIISSVPGRIFPLLILQLLWGRTDHLPPGISAVPCGTLVWVSIVLVFFHSATYVMYLPQHTVLSKSQHVNYNATLSFSTQKKLRQFRVLGQGMQSTGGGQETKLKPSDQKELWLSWPRKCHHPSTPSKKGRDSWFLSLLSKCLLKLLTHAYLTKVMVGVTSSPPSCPHSAGASS